MSLRALRRLQATGGQPSLSGAESSELKKKDEDEDVEADEDEQETEIVPATNVFDLLHTEDDDPDEDGSEEHARQEGEELECDKEDQTSDLGAKVADGARDCSEGSSNNSAKKKKKKKKSKAKTVHNERVGSVQRDDGVVQGEQIEDEIQRAIRELGLEEVSPTTDPLQGDREQSSNTEEENSDVLAANTSVLKPEAELRRIFGQRALRNEIDRGEGAGASDTVRRRGKSRRVRIPLPNCTLITPRDFWPPLKGLGISMEVDKTLPSGATLFRFKWSAQYKAVQDGFEDIVDGGDPNRIMGLLQYHPYHIGSLLAMADLFFHMGEAERAADHLERALFALEQSFHPIFNLGRTDCRINGAQDEDAVEENYIFFDTLVRQIMHLHRRGMNNAAYELCKAVFTVDRRDPYGVLHRLDMAAIRAGQYHDVVRIVQEIDILQNATTGDGNPIEPISVYSHSLGIFPGYAFSIPLSRLMDLTKGPNAENEPSIDEAIVALSQAMLLHPQMVTYLAERLSSLTTGPRWKKVLSHRLFSKSKNQAIMDKSATLNKLTRISIQTQAETWREDRALSWLLSAAERAIARCDDKSETPTEIGEDDWRCVRESSYPDSEQDEYFHLRVEEFSDEQSVTLPANEFQGAHNNAVGGGHQNAASVLESLANVEGENPLSLFLRSMMPWVAFDHGNTLESVTRNMAAQPEANADNAQREDHRGGDNEVNEDEM